MEHGAKIDTALQATYGVNGWIPKVVSEFLGTLFLSYIFIFAVSRGTAPLVIAGSYWVLLLGVGIFSKGFFNPAVTLNDVAMMKLPWKEGLMFIVAQFIGAFTGAGIAYGFRDKDVFALEPTARPDFYTLGKSFGIEILGIFFLLVFMSVSKHTNHPLQKSKLGTFSMFAILNFVLLASLSHYCGGMFNPAVDVATNVLGLHSESEFADGHLSDDEKKRVNKSLVIYFIAPLIGILLSLVVYYGFYNPTINAKSNKGELDESLRQDTEPKAKTEETEDKA